MSEPSAEQLAVPTCYRHPQRETWIRCARCDRPICPDCMTQAAVGFQCPECVAAGQASTRRPVSVFGASLDLRSTYVTYGLIGVCVAMSVLSFLVGLTGGNLNTRLGMVGLATDVGSSGRPQLIGVAAGEWYRLFTAQFMHGGLLHLAFNMYVLYVLGPQVERAFGHLRFALLFLLAGVSGAVASYVFNDPRTLSVGASGAIFGLFGAVLVIQHRMGRQTVEILGFLVLNLVLGFVIPGIDWRAHLGGLAAGTLIAAALAFSPARLRNAAFTVACLVVLAVDVTASAARTDSLRTQFLSAPQAGAAVVAAPVTNGPAVDGPAVDGPAPGGGHA